MDVVEMLDIGRDVFIRTRDEYDLLADRVGYADLIEDVRILLRAVGEDELRGADASSAAPALLRMSAGAAIRKSSLR